MASVIVFDMGGVLYDFQGDRLIARASRRQRRFRREEVQKTWQPLALRFETGACSEAEFAAEVVQRYDLSLGAGEFLAEFRAAAVGYYAGALELVRELGQRQCLVSLSNTNAVQWPVVLSGLGPAEARSFHAHHPSHLSGFHKPDPRAFQALASHYDPATHFYFFDDRAANVAAAAALGWQAHRVRGVSQARRACLELGLLG